MAASGVINGTTSNQYIAVKIEWKTLWQNTAANVSAVEAILYARRTNTGYVTSGTGSFTVSIDGTAQTTSGYVEIGTSWVQIGSNARQVVHEADGTKQINISASGSIPVAGLTSISVGGTVALDTIPRASQPSLSAATFDMGTAVTISTNRASSSFLHHIAVIWGGTRTVIANDVADSYVWTPALSMASAIPDATSGTGQIELGTWSGGQQIGVKTVDFTLRVPATVVPTAGTLTVSDPAGHTTKTGGAYVQGQSRASVAIGASSGAYGSTITGYMVEVGTASQASQSGVFDLLTAGSVTVRGTVTDSRGRTASRTQTITVAAYTAPVITSMSITRTNSAGVAEDMGSYIRAITAGSAATIEGNTLTWAVQYRLRGSADWSNLKNGSDTTAPFTWSDNTVLGGGGFDPTLSYEVRVVATDAITTTTRSLTVPTGTVTMSWGKQSVGIGKVPERGALDVAGLIYERDHDLDFLYGAGITRYDHQNGYLIQTNLPAAGNHMWELDVRFNTYGRATIDGTGWLWLQGYSSDAGNSMMNSAGRSTVGPRESRAFNWNGFLCFWIAPGNRYETAHFYLRGPRGSNNPAIINVTDSNLPTERTREAVINVRTIGYRTEWADVPTTGSSGFTRYSPLQWRRADDMILLKGGVNREAAGGWTANLAYTIGTLPVEARPPEESPITLYSEPATASTPPVMGKVLPTGEINLKAGGAAQYWVVIGGSFYAPLQ